MVEILSIAKEHAAGVIMVICMLIANVYPMRSYR